MRPTAPIARLFLALVFVAMLVFVVSAYVLKSDYGGNANALHRGAGIDKEYSARERDTDRIDTRAPLRNEGVHSSTTPIAPETATTSPEEKLVEVEEEVSSAPPASSGTSAPATPPPPQVPPAPLQTPPEIAPTDPAPVVLSRTLSLEEILLLLDTHNAARKGVGVTPLTWSPTLAESAQTWADELKGESCEWHHGDTKYGESIFYSWSSDDTFRRDADEPVFWWLNKSQYYDYEDNTCEPGEVCGHYTQAVWADTRELGCGRVYCDSNEYFEEVWVCQYDPPGNYVGERPY